MSGALGALPGPVTQGWQEETLPYMVNAKASDVLDLFIFLELRRSLKNCILNKALCKP